MRVLQRGENAFSTTSIAIPAGLKEQIQDLDVNMTQVCVKALTDEVERRRSDGPDVMGNAGALAIQRKKVLQDNGVNLNGRKN
jgi:post-segregation antitoxin (ccd killing protein)